MVKGAAVKYSGQDDLPFPVLARIWNDSKKIREVSLRYAAKAHTSGDERPLPGPPLRLRALLEEEVQGGPGAPLDLDADPDLLESYDKFLSKEAAR